MDEPVGFIHFICGIFPSTSMGRSEEKYLHCLAELSALLKERIHSPKASLLTEEFLKDYGNASFHSGLDCTI